jgi:hypothetical protein
VSVLNATVNRASRQLSLWGGLDEVPPAPIKAVRAPRAVAMPIAADESQATEPMRGAGSAGPLPQPGGIV